LIPSLLALFSASVTNYIHQKETIQNLQFIQSLDVIVVTLLSVIFSMWNTNQQKADFMPRREMVNEVSEIDDFRVDTTNFID
jgi:hypothetical protein